MKLSVVLLVLCGAIGCMAYPYQKPSYYPKPSIKGSVKPILYGQKYPGMMSKGYWGGKDCPPWLKKYFAHSSPGFASHSSFASGVGGPIVSGFGSSFGSVGFSRSGGFSPRGSFRYGPMGWFWINDDDDWFDGDDWFDDDRRFDNDGRFDDGWFDDGLFGDDRAGFRRGARFLGTRGSGRRGIGASTGSTGPSTSFTGPSRITHQQHHRQQNTWAQVPSHSRTNGVTSHTAGISGQTVGIGQAGHGITNGHETVNFPTHTARQTSWSSNSGWSSGHDNKGWSSGHDDKGWSSGHDDKGWSSGRDDGWSSGRDDGWSSGRDENGWSSGHNGNGLSGQDNGWTSQSSSWSGQSSGGWQSNTGLGQQTQVKKTFTSIP